MFCVENKIISTTATNEILEFWLIFDTQIQNKFKIEWETWHQASSLLKKEIPFSLKDGLIIATKYLDKPYVIFP